MVNPGCQVYFPSQYEVCGAIRDKYNEFGGPSSFLLWPTTNELTNPDGYGKRSVFQSGPIYWSPQGGAHPVVNHFFACWQRNGWEAGVLGYPTSDEIVNPDPDLPIGRRQYFEGGTIYWRLNEAYFVTGAIRDKFGTEGWEQGWLGYPQSDEIVLPDGIGRMNEFTGGLIYWSPTTGAWPVSGPIREKWASEGSERGPHGYPVADPSSPDGGVTQEQRFQNGTISAAGPKTLELAQRSVYMTPDEVLALANRIAQTGAATVVDFIEDALAEARDSMIILTGDPSPGEEMPLPQPRGNGDIFYSEAATSGIAHGHNGIFVSETHTVEGFNPQAGVRLIDNTADGGRMMRDPVMMWVNTKVSVREKAVDFARSRIGFPYNTNFLSNKDINGMDGGNTVGYNCSSLVWAAYKWASANTIDWDGDIDLDGDGGWGVYPDDIPKSTWVTRYP